MPLLHRLACFRDDVVFIILLYQMWLYKVDPTRENEYGSSSLLLRLVTASAVKRKLTPIGRNRSKTHWRGSSQDPRVAGEEGTREGK